MSKSTFEIDIDVEEAEILARHHRERERFCKGSEATVLQLAAATSQKKSAGRFLAGPMVGKLMTRENLQVRAQIHLDEAHSHGERADMLEGFILGVKQKEEINHQ